MRIDLHTHSTASDGTEPPAEVVRRARQAGVDLLALTDHDTFDGHAEAARAAAALGVTFLPGVEISCQDHGTTLHLLAYLADPHDAALAAEIQRLRTDRERRARTMVDRCVDLGAPITWEGVRELAQGGAVGRPHVARALVETGVVPDVSSAFSADWIGADGRAYVDKYALNPVHAIRLVRAAGGVTVMAHPFAVTRGPVVGDDVIARMAAAGLAGLEADHPDHDADARAHTRRLAAALGLLVTGGSDDHGTLTGHRIGCETTAPDVYAALLERAGGVFPGQVPG